MTSDETPSPHEPPPAWHGPQALANPLDVARLGAIYSDTAAFYDGLVGGLQASAKLIAIQTLDRGPGERFLEIGAGTGWAFSRIVAASGSEHAYALDVAAGMLAVARDALRAAGSGGAPSLLLGDARALPFPDASLDCILNTYTLEVLPAPDIVLVLRETLRVLRPAGRTVILNLTDLTSGDAADEAMIGDWKRRYAADPEYFGGARPLQLEPMLHACGFEGVSRRYAGPDWPSEVLLAYRPG